MLEKSSYEIEKEQRYSYQIMFLIGLIAIIIGFILEPSLSNVISGIKENILHHAVAEADHLALTYPGAAFVTAGLTSWLMLISFKLTKTKIEGIHWAHFFQTFGFGFVTLDFLNVLPIVVGVYLSAYFQKRPLSEQTSTAWFSLAVAPFVNYFAFEVQALKPGSPLAIAVGILVGLGLGFVAGLTVERTRSKIRGRSLLVNGANTGVLSWFFYNIMKMSGLVRKVPEVPFVEGMNTTLYSIFIIFPLTLLFAGLYYNKGLGTYRKTLLWSSTYGGNYVEEYGLGDTLINMGVMGTIAFTYCYLLPGVELSAPVLASCFMVTGFSAIGITLRSAIPLWISVWLSNGLASLIAGWINGTSFINEFVARIGTRRMATTSMYVLALCPTVERYSLLSAIFAGMIHSSNVANTTFLTGWLQSYNNGFSAGLTVTLFFPFWGAFSKQGRKELKEEL